MDRTVRGHHDTSCYPSQGNSSPWRAATPGGSAEDRVQSGEVPVDDAGDVLRRLDAVALGLPPDRKVVQDRHLVVDIGPGENPEAIDNPVIGRRMRQPAVLDVHRHARAHAGRYAPALG